MNMGSMNQLGALSPSDLVLVYSGSTTRTAPFSLVTEVARDSVFDLINRPGGLGQIGAAASGPNSDITALQGIKKSRIALDLNETDATGWYVTGVASSNQPEAKEFLVWDQHGDDLRRAQIAVSLDSGKVYTRKRAVPVGGQFAIWSAWVALNQAGDITVDTLSGASATGKALMKADSPANARGLMNISTIGNSLFTAGITLDARTAIGITTVGGALATAADTAAARTALGATAVGSSLLTATDTAAAQTAIGATAVGKTLITAGNSGAVLTATGATVVGKALVTAVDVNAALNALSATDTGKALISAVDKPAGRAAIDAMAVDAVPTPAARGGVLQQTALADLAAAPTQEDFNALLAKLRSSGVIAA